MCLKSHWNFPPTKGVVTLLLNTFTNANLLEVICASSVFIADKKTTSGLVCIGGGGYSLEKMAFSSMTTIFNFLSVQKLYNMNLLPINFFGDKHKVMT